MALSDGDRAIAAQWLAQQMYTPARTATLTQTDIRAAVNALDADLDATLTAATAAYGGATTIQNAFLASLPEPFKSTATVADKGLALCAVTLKRGGLI